MNRKYEIEEQDPKAEKEPDAESDDRFLNQCFVDTGDYGTLVDCSNPHRIIVGRTGAGKSALICHLIQNVKRNIKNRS